MLSWLLLVIVLAALTVVGTYLFGSMLGRGEALPPLDEPVEVTKENLAALHRGEPDDVRFELVYRGYRPEQVDAVIEYLWTQLEHERASKD